MPVSIRDVAAQAGVSPAAVSQVLNGYARARIAPRTRERILAAAADLGYQPNHFARTLGRGRTQTLGLVVSGLRNPFYAGVVEGVEALAAEAGYHVLVDAAPSGGEAALLQGKLNDWPVDGVLVWTLPGQAPVLPGPRWETLPVVLIGAEPAAGRDMVEIDLYGGARQAAEHALAQGCRRLAQAVPARYGSNWRCDARHRAYEDACRQAGLPLETLALEHSEHLQQAGWALGARLAERPAPNRPDVVLCHNDVAALGLLHRLRRAGVPVPQAIAVIGFDGIEEGEFLETSLTTVVIPVDSVFQQALALLLARIHGDRDTPPQRHVVPTSLLVGETS